MTLSPNFQLIMKRLVIFIGAILLTWKPLPATTSSQKAISGASTFPQTKVALIIFE
ncbi:MAG: hypothetical protein HC785_08750 [Calothrix sp. CSU_2_0]|nr:hypothetical protein [Calothrix sp. CSU_2_0]